MAAAKVKEDTLVKSASTLTNGTGAKTGTVEIDEGDAGVRPTFTGEQLVRVAQSVENIVLQSGLNEGLMFCVSYLGRRDSSRPKEWFTNSGYVREIPGGMYTKIRDRCLDVLTAQGEADAKFVSNSVKIKTRQSPLKEKLDAYLDIDLTDAEEGKRFQIAKKVAEKLGLLVGGRVLDDVINGGTESERRALILGILEVDKRTKIKAILD